MRTADAVDLIVLLVIDHIVDNHLFGCARAFQKHHRRINDGNAGVR